MNNLKYISSLILAMLLSSLVAFSQNTPVKWENVKHMKLKGTIATKTASYGYNTSMSSCQISKGGQSGTTFVEHEIKNNNAVYTFGLTNDDYFSPHDRARYLVVVKPGVGLDAYDLATSSRRYFSYVIGDKVRVERQGSTIRFIRIRNGASDNFLTVYTADANKDYFVKFNAITTGLPIDANMTTDFTCNYNNNFDESYYNWTETTIYDGLGETDCNILSESRTYFDEMGRPTQTQSRLKTDDQVWATETKYDGWGRAVLSTLPAPTKNGFIAYQSDFFNNTSGNPYNWQEDFDKEFNDYSNNPQKRDVAGGANAPTVLDQSTLGTLGNYYSDEANNIADANQAITNYPYTRTEYSLLTGAQRRVVGPGDVHRMGVGHEAAVYPMRVSEFHELYMMYGLGLHPFNIVLNYDSESDGIYDYTGSTSVQNYTDALMSNKIVKTITKDADGKETVAFTDLDGNELAVCLSGQVDGANIHTQKVSAIIPIGEFRDIHIPEGCKGIGNIAILNAGSFGGPPSTPIIYDVYDLATDAAIIDHTDPNPDPNLDEITELEPGYYRVVNQSNGKLRVNYTLNYHNFSLIVFNSLQQTIASVPPNGIDYSYCDDGTNALNMWQTQTSYLTQPDITSLPDHSELSLFKHNKRGQIEWSQTPDAGRTYFVYRKDGQLRFSQNAKQLTNNQFSYINYDEAGRPIETGVYNRPNFLPVSENLFYMPNEGKDPSIPIGYSTGVNTLVEQPFTSGFTDEESFTTYDRGASGTTRIQRFLMMRASKTWDNEGNATWYSYDSEGRMTWVAKQISGLSGIKYTDFTYDLLGNVTQVEYQVDDADEKFVHHYAYNETGEVQSSATEDNNGVVQIQTKYEYYQDGSVKTVDYGDGLQEMEYTYTIHGWLKGINLDEMNTNNAATKVFSMALDYYEGDYSPVGGSAHYSELLANELKDPSYSGNIAQSRWKTNATISGLPNISGYWAYQYEYNHRNELASAEFGSITQIANGKLNFSGSNNYKVENITYDLNGNIQTLRRYGKFSINSPNPGPTDPSYYELDNLNYTYKDGTNQLDYIQDTYGVVDPDPATDLGDIKNQYTGNYTYSEIGELIEDNSENITILYSSSGKVTEVKDKTTGQSKVKYYYDETDIRIKKEGYDNSGNIIKTTYYVFGASLNAIYEDNASSPHGPMIKELPIYGGGRVGVAYPLYTPNPNDPNDPPEELWTATSYSYELTDHLGNVRAVIQENSGAVDVTYYADYYPFGWTMPERNVGTNYRYAYQGQEKDPETGWEAFELRMYDGRVGRWMTTDPFAHKFPNWSPYNFCFNNPIKYTDPNGGEPIPFWKNRKPWQWYYYDNKTFKLAASYNTENLRYSAYESISQRNSYYVWAQTTINENHTSVNSQWFAAADIVTRWNAVGAADYIGVGTAMSVETAAFLELGNQLLFKYNMKNAKGLISNGELTGNFTDAVSKHNKLVI